MQQNKAANQERIRLHNHIVLKVIPFLLIFTLLSHSSTALPQLPSQFYGTVTINGATAPQETEIIAYYHQQNICGSSKLDQYGEYSLSCKGDNPSTSIYEGPNRGGKITFKVNDVQVSESGIWNPGSFNRIDIEITTISYAVTKQSAPKTRAEKISAYFMLICFILLVIWFIIKPKKKKERKRR